MKQPNVIIMFVDDLGYGDVSAFHKQGKIHTPHIDALADSGMKFTDSHACSPLCSPSRYGLLTGRYAFRSRLKHLTLPGDSMPLIERDRMTLAHLFSQNGYRTACVGKWHLGLQWQLNPNPQSSDFHADPEIYKRLPERFGTEPSVAMRSKGLVKGLDVDYTKPILHGPNQLGFDYFYGMAASLDQSPYVYIENDTVIEQPTAVSGQVMIDRRSKDNQTQWQCGPIAPSFRHQDVLDDMNDKVLKLLDTYSQSQEPFFLYYPTPAVHGPLLPSPRFAGKSGLNAYGDVVLQLDDMVGQISQKLQETHLAENTIFIFTSDNGCAAVADIPTLNAMGHSPSAQYRGHKFSIYEGGHRVPTIISAPSLIPAGSVCHENVCHTDFFATFAQLLNVQLPDTAAEDSYSNLDLWLESGTCQRKATVYSSSSGYLGIVSGQWKLACCELGGDSPRVTQSAVKQEPISQEFELYDIVHDPSETTNCIAQHPEIVAHLKSELSRVVGAGRSTDGQAQQNFVPPSWVQLNWY